LPPSNTRAPTRPASARNAGPTHWSTNGRRPGGVFGKPSIPDQPGGSPIALPNDPAIRADLVAPRFKDTPRGLLLAEKIEIAKRLGRSPDAGHAIVLAWSEGQCAVGKGLTGPSYRPGGHNDRPDSYLKGRTATERARARHARGAISLSHTRPNDEPSTCPEYE
jgi:hypothetical protein